jgi:hypothetical protein
VGTFDGNPSAENSQCADRQTPQPPRSTQPCIMGVGLAWWQAAVGLDETHELCLAELRRAAAPIQTIGGPREKIPEKRAHHRV